MVENQKLNLFKSKPENVTRLNKKRYSVSLRPIPEMGTGELDAEGMACDELTSHLDGDRHTPSGRNAPD